MNKINLGTALCKALAISMLGTAGLVYATTTVNLVAQRATATLPDGTSVPMWQFCAPVNPPPIVSTSGGTLSTVGCTGAWAPGPTITVPVGDTLNINLTNTLKVPTSIVVLGQLGGGLGNGVRMPSPPHNNTIGVTAASTVANIASVSEALSVVSVTTVTAHQLTSGQSTRIGGVPVGGYNGDFVVTVTGLNTFTYVDGAAGLAPSSGGTSRQLLPAAQNVATFPNNSLGSAALVAPTQADRIRSFGTEVPAGARTAPGSPLTWVALRPGTYIYETGTLPSLEAPMGLYGILIVTNAPVAANPASSTAFVPGNAYPNSSAGVTYDSDVALLFSEVDPAQNAQVDAAAQFGTDIASNLRFTDPACATQGTSGASVCYPAAVNYTPTYFLINGQAFDRTRVDLSSWIVGSSYSTGKVLLRMANAGSRTHIPSVIGLPVALVAEDGNLAPGNPKLQNEVLLTAGKTYDGLVSPAATLGSYTPGTFGVFDRQGSLSTANQPDGGMQGYLLVNGVGVGAGLAGGVPKTAAAKAVNDSFSVPAGASINGNVRLNDISVKNVVLVSAPKMGGTLTLNSDGSFIYAPPTVGFTGTDTFTYSGNVDASNLGTTNIATVTLTVGSAMSPLAANDSYISNVASVLRVPSPGVLANDSDPANLQIKVDTASVAASTCGTVSMSADGSFTATRGAAANCSFTYKVKNSQGASSNVATVMLSFSAGSGVVLNVVDAGDARRGVTTPIADYKWIIQENMTFQVDTSATPSLTTRTLGTSFHRAHNPVLASGCVGPISCGSGQSTAIGNGARKVVSDADALTIQAMVGDVALDAAKQYYVSVLPADAQNPAINAGGAPINVLDATGNVVGKRQFDLSKDCGTIGSATDPCGHTMSGTAIGASQIAVKSATVQLQRTPVQPAQLSVFIYEDNNPTNGQNDLNENGLGGFNLILFDPAGRSGDPAGQQTYDAFNEPLTNALLGTPGCLNDQNATAAAAAGNNIVGTIFTCPNAPRPLPPGRTAADYTLAGHALIKNVTPARYDVLAHPSAAREGAGEVWWQTETLEGTPAQDAFTGINEPRYFQEFGPPGFHTTIGFVNPQHVNDFATATRQTGAFSIAGHITNQHMSRPSNTTLWDSGSNALLSATVCRVALNAGGGTGATIATAMCDAKGNFTLSGVPAGSYEVAIFDQWLDQIIQTRAVNVTAQGPAVVDMGAIPVLSWFSQHEQYQLLDDGTSNPPGISNVLMTVRYRNGSISNRAITDGTGNAPLLELFPLFNWYVSESDTTRFKQKSVKITVDGGGAVDTTGPGAGLIASKYPTGESTVRTETPGSLSYGIQGFISQRNRIDWLDTPYAVGENGGILGNVVLASTRPFDDQRRNVQNIWEPLVPRVTVNLYKREKHADGTRTLTKVDSTLTTSWDDWVNTVYGADNIKYILGPDQVLRDPLTGVAQPKGGAAYPPGKQANMSCPGQLPGPAAGSTPPFDTTQVDPFTSYTLNGDQFRCYDGFHAWNQVQAAPYDGKYQFPSAVYITAHALCSATVTTNCTVPVTGQTLVSLPVGDYVVEAVTPVGYRIAKEEDKDILAGDAFIAPAVQQFGALANVYILPDQATLNNVNLNNPNTGDAGFQSNPNSNLGDTGIGIGFPECVGEMHRVPDFLSQFPQQKLVAPFAGADRPLCDKKLVKLGDQMQGKAMFFVYTETPAAAHGTGIVLDDASAEFNAASPDFGEKSSVPFVPVSTKDFTGLEISRVYADQWGAYNLMLPSSWLVNPPTPSGYGPNMLVNCINDPGPIPDPSGTVDPATGKVRMVTDPAYNPAYSNFCYTNPFMPGQATYLDTPLLPIAAFAAGYNPADCDYPDATPAIALVNSNAGFGPYLSSIGGSLTITALGDRQVQNPAYAGPFATSGPASNPKIMRHYGFGASQGAGKVTLGGATLVVTGWNDTTITVTVAALPAGTSTLSGELVITADNGKSTVDAVTVTQEAASPTRVQGASGQTIQAAIDAAKPGDLILVDAGMYNELVLMWKPVRLQGVGAASVIINAAKFPTSKLENWRPLVNAMFGIDTATGNPSAIPQVDPLPGQEVTGGVVLLEPSVLGTEEGAGITVLAKGYKADGVTPLGSSAIDCAYASTAVAFNLTSGSQTVAQPGLSNFLCAASRIDGVSVTGGDAGGGIYVNGWAHNLQITNNRVYGNAGALHGGIRIGVPYLQIYGYPGQIVTAAGTLGGVPTLTAGAITGLGYDRNVAIHHNSITKNGVVEGPAGNGGAGGGVSICTGTDGYSVDHNWICGNNSQSDGGGIGHLGFSQNGSITFNQILFNQSFQQTSSTHGGGIFVGGEPPLALQTQTLGSGNLAIDANVIRGNFAEAGHGGGIRLQQVNGADVQYFPATRNAWNAVTVTNNVLDNNVAGWSGGGISLADTLVSVLANNTIAANDSAGIAGPLLSGASLPSTTTIVGTGKPNPAGVSAELNSALLRQVLPANLASPQKDISAPNLTNNIIWHNRSFFFRTVNGNPSLCSSNNIADANGTGCTILPQQAVTGSCTGTPAYWDLGVVGDDNAAAPGANALTPTFSVLSVSTGLYGAAASVGNLVGTHNSNADPMLRDLYCNGARVTPEFGTVLNPPGPLSMQVAATVDEGNNYVSLRYGPLSLSNASNSMPIGNYHLATTANSGNSSAVDHGIVGLVPHDVDSNPRPQGAAWDIGAVEIPGPAPIVKINPGTLVFGNQVGGTYSLAQQVTVTNIGNANLVFNGAAVPMGVAVLGKFAIAPGAAGDTCTGATLAPNASCTVGVIFAPVGFAGVHAGTLRLRDTLGTQTIALSGLATRAVAVTPKPLSFSSQKVGTNSAIQLVTFTNNQGTPVTFAAANGISITTFASDFVPQGEFVIVPGAGNCASAVSVPAGGQCVVGVQFMPAGKTGLRGLFGVRMGALTFRDDVIGGGAGSPQTVTLNGLATP